jgi:hypothetical protein
MWTLGQERARLQAHFASMVRELGGPRSGLSRAQRRGRARVVEELARYGARGRFPRNTSGRWRPVFVDELGTRCAVGHLLEATGRGDLTRAVAGSANFARVRELVGVEELVAWLDEVGLTAAEAARIQPEYNPASSDCLCGGPSAPAVPTVLEVTAIAHDAAVVDVVHGEARMFQVGDVIEMAWSKVELRYGERGVGPVYDTLFIPLLLNPDDSVSVGRCKRTQEAPALVSKELLVEAWMSQECWDLLVERVPTLGPSDQGWLGEEPEPEPAAGCAQAPDAIGADALWLPAAAFAVLTCARRSLSKLIPQCQKRPGLRGAQT